MSNRSDKMANWPIGKLLFSMGLPATFSMLIQALYNVVDSIYISRYSQDALFAIGVVTPFIMIGFSIALGSSVGISTIVARRLGERNKDEAQAVASTGLVLTLCHILIVVLLCFTLGKPFIELFTDRQEIITLGLSYVSICMYCCFGQHLAIFYERLMQGQSNMMVPMFAQLSGAITNIILDPILIFGAGPIPAMGIKGAAIATVAGQILQTIICLIFYKKEEVKIVLKGIKLEFKRIKGIYALGIPTMIMNSVISITTTLMNTIIVDFTEDAVSSLSIYFKLQSFVFMPVFGFAQGALPILSYNYGAMNKKRYVDTFKLFLTTNIVLLILGTLLFRFKTDLVLSFFTMSDHLNIIATAALRTICLSFVPAAISISMGNVFQSFGQGFYSMMQSILRQIVFLVPIAYLLSRTGILANVWYAYPIAELIVCLIYIPLTITTFKRHFNVN